MGRLYISFGVVCALAVGYCHAAIPQKMNYQGKLTDATGKLVGDGNYEMIFSIYDAESGGTQEWTETWNSGTTQVAVANGLFNVLLGSHSPLTVDFAENYWLEQQVKHGGSYETLLPRQQVASVGYAMRAEKVTDGAITDASISASAAIADTKLATITTAGKVSGSAVNGGTLGTANGSALTNLNASNVSSGTLGATYLPADGYASTYVNAGGDTMTGSLALPSNGLAVGTSQLVVSGGNVGIGTTSPNVPLDVINSSSDIFQFGTDASNYIYGANDGSTGFRMGVTDTSKSLAFQTSGGTTRLFIASGGNVGIGTTTPGGKLDVNGTIYQRGASLHADYVFAPGYELEPIEEHAEYMWRNKHLKAVPKATKDEAGQEVLEIGADRKGIVEELEKAHVYIQQMNDRINALEAWIDDVTVPQ